MLSICPQTTLASCCFLVGRGLPKGGSPTVTLLANPVLILMIQAPSPDSYTNSWNLCPLFFNIRHYEESFFQCELPDAFSTWADNLLPSVGSHPPLPPFLTSLVCLVYTWLWSLFFQSSDCSLVYWVRCEWYLVGYMGWGELRVVILLSHFLSLLLTHTLLNLSSSPKCKQVVAESDKSIL